MYKFCLVKKVEIYSLNFYFASKIVLRTRIFNHS